MSTPVESIYEEAHVSGESWLAIKAILMKFAAVIVDDGGLWLCKSSKEDVEWMFWRFVTLLTSSPQIPC